MALPQIAIGDGMIGDGLLVSVHVVQELNQHWHCTIEYRNTEDQRIAVEDLLGKSVQVKTTDQDGTEHIHFSGLVSDVELEYEVWGSYTARVIAISDSWKLDLTARKQYYSDQSLSSIAGTVGGRDGVGVAVSAGSRKSLNYVQYGETDWNFLLRITDDYGAWMRPGDKNVEVFDSFQAGSSLQWRSEDGLISFRLRGALASASYSGSHYDHHAMESNNFQQVSKAPQYYSSAQRLTSAVQSASAQLPPGFEAQRARAMTLADYNDQLQAESERSMGGAVTGTGSSRNQQLKAGNTVQLDGVLDAKGTYGLLRVVHEWTRQGYTNDFVCTPWKNYRNPAPPKARTWNGVVPARVVDHNDPKKMGRIKVQFFWQDDGSTHWARTTSPHAGPDRGFMFMPEVGDEVAVAFEDGDPERPVVLGSLWNGIQQAPRYDFRGGDIEPNHVKRLVTKSGNRLHLSDLPGKETVFLATPKATSLSMTEKSDETGRQLIHVHSDGDIVLTAPNGRVHIQSQFFSREIGSAGGSSKKAEAAAAPAAAAAAPVAKEGFLHGLAGGLYSSTVEPLAHMIRHPIDTVEGIGHAIANPVQTAKAIGHAAAETTRGVLSGDGRSIGTAVGTVGMFAIPGAGEAGAVEDAARVGKVGELAEASRVAEVGDAGKVAELGDVGKVASWKDLRAANVADVDNVSTFKTLGVSDADAANYLNTAEGQKYLDNMQAGSPALSPDKVYQYAKGQVMSGSELPTAVSDTQPLYKVVPQGETPSMTSPYYLTHDQLNQAINSGEHLGSQAGLPLKTHADVYDIFRTEPSSTAAGLYQSPIAPTSELNGAYVTKSDLTQSLLTNKTGWSAPQQVGSVLGQGGVPLP